MSSDLIKVFSITGLSTLVKLLTSYITVKIVASVIGPGGIALIGQLQNFTAIFTTLGAGGINNGVVKYVSEYRDDETMLHNYLRNGFKITIFLSLFFGLVLMTFSGYLTKWILLDERFSFVFILFGITLTLLSVNNFFLSVLNGFKDYKRFVTINIITSLVGLAFSVILVLLFGLVGALTATVSYQSIVLFITLFYLRKSPWYSRTILWGRNNKETVRRYFSYSLMAVVSAATVPVSQLVVRGVLIDHYAIETAGYWEGMNRISGLYLLFFTTTFSIYYLPKLSEIKDTQKLRDEIVNVYKILVPVISGSLFLIYLLKDFLITLLFTKEFHPMKDLFLWQLGGDFFKIMSWILAFVMVAKSMVKLYIITEIMFAIIFVGLSMVFISYFGVIGATHSYCLTYFLYFVAMAVIFRKLIF